MRPEKLYERKGLDLHDLWKRAGRTPPGSILVLPSDNGRKTGKGSDPAQDSPKG